MDGPFLRQLGPEAVGWESGGAHQIHLVGITYSKLWRHGQRLALRPLGHSASGRHRGEAWNGRGRSGHSPDHSNGSEIDHDSMKVPNYGSFHHGKPPGVRIRDLHTLYASNFLTRGQDYFENACGASVKSFQAHRSQEPPLPPSSDAWPPATLSTAFVKGS